MVIQEKLEGVVSIIEICCMHEILKECKISHFLKDMFLQQRNPRGK